MAPKYLDSHFHQFLSALKHNVAVVAVVVDAVAAGDAVVGDVTCSDD